MVEKNIFVLILLMINFSLVMPSMQSQIFLIINLIGVAAHDDSLILQLKNDFPVDFKKGSLFYNNLIYLSLKDLKVINWINFFDRYEDQVAQILDSQYITKNMVITQQRNCRNSIKNMIKNLENIPNSHELSSLLEKIFHNLYEVKKEIMIVDSLSESYALYIYFILSLLNYFINKITVDCTPNGLSLLEQQQVLDNNIYLLEQFEYGLNFNFLI